MSVFRYFDMPKNLQEKVARHYLNKLAGMKSTPDLMGAKNLFKLFRRIPNLTVKADQHGYLLTINGVQALARPHPSSDLITFLEVWGKKEYQKSIDYLKLTNSGTPFIIDVGSNVGYATIFFKHHFPKARIICLEPDKGNLNQLRSNIHRNNLTDVDVIEGALWKERGRLELKNDYREGTSASLYVVQSDAGEIEGYTMEDVINGKQVPIDLLKIDIEGAEKYLFEDATTARSILSKCRSIAIEIHDEKANRKVINQNLIENGFQLTEEGETTFGMKLNS